MNMLSFLKTWVRASGCMTWTVLMPVRPGTGPLRVMTIHRWLMRAWSSQPPRVWMVRESLRRDVADHEANFVHVGGEHDAGLVVGLIADAGD